MSAPYQPKEIQDIQEQLLADFKLDAAPIYLAIGDVGIKVQSNSQTLLDLLSHYFNPVVSTKTDHQLTVTAINRNDPNINTGEFKDWQRENGKVGRKDSYCDLSNARVIRKVRTGMVFLQSDTVRIAAGQCLKNNNQVINFINAQYMCWLQQRGWMTCHAAGVKHSNGRGFAMAGLSGGGKSTLMLHLLENPNINYLSNDRLFIRSSGNSTSAAGIPKLPRINPGTIVNNERLRPLISQQRLQEVRQLPNAELWDLEEKYDVIIDELYGPNRIDTQALLTGFVVLNWQRNSADELRLEQVDLVDRADLLTAIMKSPGPFFQHTNGSFHQDTAPLDAQGYIDNLRNIPIYEVSGGVDFHSLAKRCMHLLEI